MDVKRYQFDRPYTCRNASNDVDNYVRYDDIKDYITRPDPVLNDGKAEPDLSQRPPFVTGLSVKPNPDRQCSFCGAEHEYRNLFPGVNACICRSCIVQAVEWKEAQS